MYVAAFRRIVTDAYFWFHKLVSSVFTVRINVKGSTYGLASQHFYNSYAVTPY